AGAGGMRFPWDNLVVIPPDAWIYVEGWIHTDPSDPLIDLDRPLCPGFSEFWEGLALPADLGSIQGQLVFINGVWAVRLSLVGLVQSLPSIGFIPPGGTVDTFDIWLAQDGGWLVAVEFHGTTGEGDPVGMRVDVTNNPGIQVNAPIP
ncbi:MAG: hypothetical protein MUP62_04575, partial [Dehalococcoidia bacterium]|nr:hypothetical protein [Dehalococcoidia bacterium]